MTVRLGVLVLACAASALAPALAPPPRAPETSQFPGWPRDLDGIPLTPLPLTEQEAAFAREFPGRIGRFGTPQGECVLRWVDRPTRRLHSGADCYRGAGWTVEGRGPERRDGAVWGVFRAERRGVTVVVQERIVDARGGSWSDVSAWYWAAVLGRSDGPWVAITRVVRIGG